MVEERTTIRRAPNGDTIETRTTENRGGGAGWLIGFLILAALVVGFFVLMQRANHETMKDEAVTSAAQDVGAAARDVGQAASAVSADVVSNAQTSADRAAEAATRAAEGAATNANQAADAAADTADRAAADVESATR